MSHPSQQVVRLKVQYSSNTLYNNPHEPNSYPDGTLNSNLMLENWFQVYKQGSPVLSRQILAISSLLSHDDHILLCSSEVLQQCLEETILNLHIRNVGSMNSFIRHQILQQLNKVRLDLTRQFQLSTEERVRFLCVSQSSTTTTHEHPIHRLLFICQLWTCIEKGYNDLQALTAIFSANTANNNKKERHSPRKLLIDSFFFYS